MTMRMPQNLLQQAVQQVTPEKLKSTMCVFGQTLHYEKTELGRVVSMTTNSSSEGEELSENASILLLSFDKKTIFKASNVTFALDQKCYNADVEQVNRFAFIKIHRAYLCHYTTTESSVFVGKTGLY